MVISRPALLACAALALACGGPVPQTRVGEDAHEWFARVKAAHTQFVAARRTLEHAEAEGGRPTAEGEALSRARSAFDAAYTTEQKALATFLTIALNEAPQAEETKEALSWYAEAAVENARMLVDRGGEAARAARVLEHAQRLFLSSGVVPPPELTEALAAARRPAPSQPTPAAGDPH